MGKRILTIMLLVMTGAATLLSLIPNPQSGEIIEDGEVVISERFSPQLQNGREPDLPQHVLVLMVEFPDHHFGDTITNQDYLENPEYRVYDYIDRFMYHLQSYYLDVSREAYEINYTVLDSLITLPQPITWYGDRDRGLERRIQLAQDVIAHIDGVIDFAEYDAYMMLHSGAGREADIYGTNPKAISSSFVNRRLLQAVLDPENDDFPGLETSDGIYIEEFIISATNHDHPDNPENLNYGVIGLLCHLFGRQIGLPTLFGNVSSLGRAAGVGNFCLMGTGVWNANGFVPPFLSAWTRKFAGWDEAVTIDKSSGSLPLTYPFNPENLDIPRIYKILISEDEYYLVENRQQNPDGSQLGGQPTFTFRLLPGDEQDYYPPPFEMVPRFNFMTNTYRDCEWDFFLPGLGGPDFPEIDGSGILIWHVDENVIRENYETNTINADPNHQGITLMEADGIQHLRSSIPDLYSRGSAFDAYRAGHNDYFGKMYKSDGSLSIPYAESFYGETDLEISHISSADNIMTFSVTYPWSLFYDHQGADTMPPAIIKGADNDIYLLQALHSGKIFLFRNFELMTGYPVETDPIAYFHAYLDGVETFIVPVMSEENGAAYLRVNSDEIETSSFYQNYRWASHPVGLNDSGSDAGLALALNHRTEHSSMLLIKDENSVLIYCFSMHSGVIASNMIQRGNELFFFMKRPDGSLSLQRVDLINYEKNETAVSLPPEISIRSVIMGPVTRDLLRDERYHDNFVLLSDDSMLYLLSEDGDIEKGFPLQLPDEILSVPVLADINRNGFLEILLVSSNNLFVIGYNGELLNYPVGGDLPYPSEEEGYLGVTVMDLNGDGNPEIVASLGGNRMAVWDNKFRVKSGYPLMLPYQPHYAPLPFRIGDRFYLYSSAENGHIYRYSFPGATMPEGWYTEHGNLQRSGYYAAELQENIIKTESIFVRENCYLFPVPLTYQNGGVLYFNIMVSQNLPVEVKIFDISGKQIFKDILECQAYTNNRNRLKLDINGMATGVYFTRLRAKGETLTIRFSVER